MRIKESLKLTISIQFWIHILHHMSDLTTVLSFTLVAQQSTFLYSV